MVASSLLHGNVIIFDWDKMAYVYEDGEIARQYEKKVIEKDGEYYTLLDTVGDNNYRACPRCGEMPTKEGHDACLGHIPDVRYACCGHGIDKPYIIWEKDK
jgi:hypothetical protein